MYRDYNMGTGLEIMVKEDYAEEILDITEKFDLEAKVIGKCKKSNNGNKLTIKSEFGEFNYAE